MTDTAKTLEQVRRDAEQRMRSQLTFSFSESDWGKQMIKMAGNDAVKRARGERFNAS